MILNKQDLKRYMLMDKIALSRTEKHPHLFGDEVWKFEIALRKHEYYVNMPETFWRKAMRMFYAWKHHRLGIKLGFTVPCNTCAGGYV